MLLSQINEKKHDITKKKKYVLLVVMTKRNKIIIINNKIIICLPSVRHSGLLWEIMMVERRTHRVALKVAFSLFFAFDVVSVTTVYGCFKKPIHFVTTLEGTLTS